ncbi:MAG: Uma2 family endonuclease, partial [Thermoleophilaceae bacterium]
MEMALRETYRFSVHDYHRMVHAGILTEDSPVELIEGELVQVAPVGSRHAACVDQLNKHLAIAVGDDVI